MTRDELMNILRRYLLSDGVAQHALEQIWGQPFEGETVKIKSVTEESSTTSCGQNPLHPRENCSWWQFGRCPTDCVHSATRLDL